MGALFHDKWHITRCSAPSRLGGLHSLSAALTTNSSTAGPPPPMRTGPWLTAAARRYGDDGILPVATIPDRDDEAHHERRGLTWSSMSDRRLVSRGVFLAGRTDELRAWLPLPIVDDLHDVERGHHKAKSCFVFDVSDRLRIICFFSNPLPKGMLCSS